MSDFIYDDAVKEYITLRDAVDAIENEAKIKKAELRAVMSRIEAQITAHAQADGLVTVPTKHGTAYWSTHYSCTCASRDELFDYVRQHEAWDLLESRPSKSAVKSLVEATGSPPPGVNFSAYRVLNIRAK
jgi:hypothetical protein